MTSKIKILTCIGAAFLLIIMLSVVLVKNSLRNRIETLLAENKSGYTITVEKIRISMFSRGIILEKIGISTNNDSIEAVNINGEIGSINLSGTHLVKAVLKKEIHIRKIKVSDTYIKGSISSRHSSGKPVVIPLVINLGILSFDRINFSLENDSSARSFYLKDGNITFYGMDTEKYDTLNSSILKPFDFSAAEIALVSADSMYSYSFNHIKYSANSELLGIDSFSIRPNYDNYNFTAHYKYQKSRISAIFSNILIHGVKPSEYIRSGTIATSFVQIGETGIKVFRDKRMEFHHIDRSAFQDIIYRYPGLIRIDSIELAESNILYTEHAMGANMHGSLSFTGLTARIYNITNDTIYKTETGFLKLKAEAMLMGKGKVTIQLKARLFDDINTFSVNGKLAAMELAEINPFLEKTAFIYVTSGKIEEMNFSFVADNTHATGNVTMLYTGLDLAAKNKITDDTLAIKERVVSFFINRKVLASNPLPDKEIRDGIIDYSRDPERFLFSYFARSLMSGIRSSLLR